MLGAAMIVALPVGILAGVLTAVGGELMHKRAVAEQRELVAHRLGQVVNEVFGRLRDATVEQVFTAYNEALAQLRQRHEAWLHDRVRTYERAPAPQVDGADQRLRADAARLKGQLQALAGKEEARA
jgi:cytochrome c2